MLHDDGLERKEWVHGVVVKHDLDGNSTLQHSHQQLLGCSEWWAQVAFDTLVFW